jgi:hypothetical protein
MMALGDPALEKRNAHPLVKELQRQRRAAVANMLCDLADRIRDGAHEPEFFEETEGHWSDRFFRTAVAEGIEIRARIDFYNPLDRSFTKGTPGLKIDMIVERHMFVGCDPLPLEVELVNDIPSEEP